MANKGKRMLFEDEYRYLDKVIETYPDPTDIGGGGGSPIEAGTGIEITGDETKTISIDNTVALKTDIPSTTNLVTTNTTQTVTGDKTFTGNVIFNPANVNYNKFKFKGTNPIEMITPNSGAASTGFTLFNSSNVEKGYFQYNARNGQDALYLGRFGDNAATDLGFLSEKSNRTGYRVLLPNKTSTSGATQAKNTYYIPTEVTDGTNTVKATSEGVINISSLLPTVPTLYRHEVALDSVAAHDKIWLTIFNYDSTPFTLDTLWTYLVGLRTNTVNRISASGRWVDDQAQSNNVYWITDIFDSGTGSLTCGTWNTADGNSKNHGISKSNRSIKDKVITIS